MELKKGDRVKVKPGANHDEMTKEASGTIEEVSTPALGIIFDDMPDEMHKWYVEEELEKIGDSEGDATMDAEVQQILAARHKVGRAVPRRRGT